MSKRVREQDEEGSSTTSSSPPPPPPPAKRQRPRYMPLHKLKDALKNTFKDDTPQIQPRHTTFHITGKGTGHGNYTGYHRLRNPELDKWQDFRITVVYPFIEHIEHPAILDIGCNEGNFPLTLGLKTDASKIVGLDIDNFLIEKALRNLKTAGKERAFAHIQHGIEFKSRAEQGDLQNIDLDFKDRVTFIVGNIVDKMKDEQFRSENQQLYDIISCLNVTKWIHVNNGDEQIKELFRFVHEALKPKGFFFLEFQPWKNYKKDRYTEKQVEMRSTIKFHPGQFKKFLSEELGMTMLAEGDVHGGMRRPFLIMQKES